jgi:hypothetical protein
MADSDGLRQLYGIPGVSGVRPGYVFAKKRQQDRRDGKKKDHLQDAGKPGEEAGEEKKGVDIKV